MAVSIDPIGQIRRDHPRANPLQSETRELQELWALYGQWKDQRRELKGAKDQLTAQSPKSTVIISKVLGSLPEFEQAGEALKSSITARLVKIGKHHLTAAVTRGELTATEEQQVEQIKLQWQREAELEAIGQSYKRDDERER